MSIRTKTVTLLRTDRTVRLAALAAVVQFVGVIAIGVWEHSMASEEQVFSEQIGIQRRTIERMQTNLRAIDLVLEKRARIEELSRQAQDIVSQSAVVSLVADIANRAGVKVRDQHFDDREKTASGLDSYSQVVVVEGKYKSVRAFLRSIENSKIGITVIEKALITSTDGGIAARLRIVTFSIGGKDD